MKYLACAFRNGVMIHSARVTPEQIMFFKDNVCSQFNVLPESLTLVKYDLTAVKRLEGYENCSIKIGVDAANLVLFQDKEIDTAEAVDMMTASLEELAEFYSEDEIVLIMENREMEDESEFHPVARRIKYGKKQIKEESVIETLQPEL
jgi:hypothetical protein